MVTKRLEPLAVVVERVEVVEQRVDLSLDELCRFAGIEQTVVVELVSHGLVEPLAADPWRFRGDSLSVIRRAHRLMHDLGVNAAGAAVAIELLERIEQLERRGPATGSR